MSAEQHLERWGPQMGEHALFMYLLLHEPNLKQRALELFHKWQNFVCSNYPGGVPVAIQMLEELKAYKTEVLNRLNANEWLGSIFPDFVDHIRFELLYFEAKLLGQQFTAGEEVAFCDRINADHAEFAAHLLDPTEVKLVDQADATSKKIRKLPRRSDLESVVLAMEAGVDLNNFNSKAYEALLEGKLKSIIHPTLLRHVIREGQILNNILGSLVEKPPTMTIDPDICRTNV